MASINLKLEGLDSLRESLSKTTFDNKLKTTIGLFSTQLHSSLRFAIKRTYAIDKSLDSVLIGNSISITKRGEGFLENNLNYLDKNLRLAEFPLNTFMGNINPSASIPGQVVQVSIRRGTSKIVYGRKGYGGFLRKRSENVKVNQIFERQTKRRKPIKPLYGIGLAKMARIMYDYDSDVQKVKNKLSTEILSLL